MQQKEQRKTKEEILEDQIPDHIPSVPLDVLREREKEEARRKAEELRKKVGKYQPIIITFDGTEKKLNQLNIHEKEMEFIKCATDPIYFIETYLTIFDQTQGVAGLIVPFKLFDFQKDLIHSYVENRFVVANKYRQAGISTTTCAFIAWYVMFNQNRQVAIVADKLETARDELMNDVVDFIENCPDFLKPKTGRDSEKNLKDTQKLKVYDNNSKLGAFSSKGLRGYTPSLIFWDETAWTEKSGKFWTSAQPTLQTGGAAIMVSCVTEDTYLFTNKGIKQIKDFKDKIHISNKNSEIIKSNTSLDINVNTLNIDDNIPTIKEVTPLGAYVIDEYSVLGKDKLRSGQLFFNNGYVDTLKVNTTYSSLESSLNHKYWAYKVSERKYDWFKASELEVDDYVSIQYGMNIWGDNDDCSDFRPTESPYIKNVFKPDKITPDLAYLLGLYLSEGYAVDIYSKNCVKTTSFNLTCGDSLTHVFDKLGFTCYFDGIHYHVSSKNLGEFLKYLGFDLTKKAKEKVIPSRLLEMSKENIVALIQGIMDGDGWTTYLGSNNTITVGISLASKTMIEQLRILFNNFGILTIHKEGITKPTKLVKSESYHYRINTSGKYAQTYFKEIGFRFERKQNKILEYKFDPTATQGRNNDTIPNGGEILYELYPKIKRPNIFKSLLEYNINIEPYVTERRFKELPLNRFTLLKLINYIKSNYIDNNLDNSVVNQLTTEDINFNNIIETNLHWTKIKSIEKSKNNTYDFSLPNNNPEENDFHHSVVYNQIVTHNTPSGLDETFYKTFMGARNKENNFKAVELWWFNDPRYNRELCWLKNKGKENEIRLVDENWDNKRRVQLMDDNWEASSPWFEEQVRNANGDMKKIAQELLCSFLGSGDNFIAEEYLRRIEEHEIRVPIRQEYLDRNMWIWEDAQVGENYLMTIDASPGHGEDNSTINILKTIEVIEEKVVIKGDKVKKIKINRHKVEQVAEYYGKITPQALSEVAYQFGKRYNDAYCVVDITGGYGVQSVEKLLEIGYESVHYAEVSHKPSRDRLQGYIKKGQKIMSDGAVMNVDLIPGFFIGNNRASVLLELQRAIHLEDVIIHSVRLLNELKTFVTVAGNRVADHKRSFHDDSIMGLSVGLYVLNFDMVKFKQSKGITEKLLNALMTNNDINNIERERGVKNKPMMNPSSSNPLNPYLSNGWLFNGLKFR